MTFCRKIPLILFCGNILFYLCSCSSMVNSHEQKKEMIAAYRLGNDKTVSMKLRAKLGRGFFSVTGSGDELMWRLEAGGYKFLTGKDDESIQHFNRAEFLIGDYDQRAVVNMRQIGSESAVLVTNMNSLPYRGFCRDRVLYPVFRGFAYLGKGDESGFRTELFRLRENQDKVMSDYRKYFAAESESVAGSKKQNPEAAKNTDPSKILSDKKNADFSARINDVRTVAHKGYGNFMNPFAIFMSGYGFLRDGDFENAVIDFERLYKALPGNPVVQKYYAALLKQTNRPAPALLKKTNPFDFPLDRENVLVVFANGCSGAFKQFPLYIPVVFPGYATIVSVAWPVCEYYPAPFQTLSVSAGGKIWQTTPIADMDGILSQEYTERLAGMITRTALSVAAKEFGSYVVTRIAAEADTTAGIFTGIGMAVYKIAMNTADTRSWEMLPKEFQIVQFPMPADRTVVWNAGNGKSGRIVFSPAARSAIIYVNAPSSAFVSARSFELKTK